MMWRTHSLRAASPLLATPSPDILSTRDQCVEMSLETARTCACATSLRQL